MANAEADLAKATVPDKFVTNYCYAPKGTEKLGFLVRAWGEHDPHGGTISDDVKSMYQNVSRCAGFDYSIRRSLIVP